MCMVFFMANVCFRSIEIFEQTSAKMVYCPVETVIFQPEVWIVKENAINVVRGPLCVHRTRYHTVTVTVFTTNSIKTRSKNICRGIAILASKLICYSNSMWYSKHSIMWFLDNEVNRIFTWIARAVCVFAKTIAKIMYSCSGWLMKLWKPKQKAKSDFNAIKSCCYFCFYFGSICFVDKTLKQKNACHWLNHLHVFAHLNNRK